MQGRQNRTVDTRSDGDLAAAETRGNGRFERKPIHEIRVRTSKNGDYVLIDSIETWIFPTEYFATIVANAKKPKGTPADPPAVHAA